MMGKQTQTQLNAKQSGRKWNLYLLLSVTLLSLTSSAANIYELSPEHKRKSSVNLTYDAVKLSTTEDTVSTTSASPSQRHLLHTAVVSRSLSPQQSGPHFQSDFAAIPDVSVTCGRSDFVVRVKPAFYGLGADASELRLGHGCKSNHVLRPYGDLLFTYPLTECDVKRELLHGYLVYKFVLHYNPSPERFPSKAHPVSVNIECRYQRNHYLHLLAIQPTWKTAIAHRRLKTSQTNFHIQLMDVTWSNPVKSRVFQLGEMVNFQVSAPHLPPGRKLYINSCYATPLSHSESHIKFTIIDNYGCLLDSKTDPGASKFISRTNKSLRFSIKAFQFITDPDAEISMHCQLYVTSAGPSPAHKSCTYAHNRWEALSGDDAICKCCDSQCVTSKLRRAMMDGIASSRSLWVSGYPHTSNTMVHTSAIDKMHDKTDKQKKHLEEGPDLIEIINYEQERSEVKDSKRTEKELKLHKDDADKKKVHILDLKRVNNTKGGLAYQRMISKAAPKKKDALPMDSEREKEKQKCADGNVKEVLKQSQKNSDRNEDVLDKKDTTWYFTWR